MRQPVHLRLFRIESGLLNLATEAAQRAVPLHQIAERLDALRRELADVRETMVGSCRSPVAATTLTEEKQHDD